MDSVPTEMEAYDSLNEEADQFSLYSAEVHINTPLSKIFKSKYVVPDQYEMIINDEIDPVSKKNFGNEHIKMVKIKNPEQELLEMTNSQPNSLNTNIKAMKRKNKISTNRSASRTKEVKYINKNGLT